MTVLYAGSASSQHQRFAAGGSSFRTAASMLLTLFVCAHMQEPAVAARPAVEDLTVSGGGRFVAESGPRTNLSSQGDQWIRIQNKLGTMVQITLSFPADKVNYFWGDVPADGIFERLINPQVAMNVGVTVVPPQFKGETKDLPKVSAAQEIMNSAMFWGGHLYTAATLGTSGTMVAGLQAALSTFASQVATKAATDGATEVAKQTGLLPPRLWPFKLFREVWPSPKKEHVTDLVWDEKEGLTLVGVHQQCESDEEVFWGCCYKKCSELSLNKFPWRCGTNICGRDEGCNWFGGTEMKGLVCDGYAVGFGEENAPKTARCCRFPSSKKYEGVEKTK